MQKGTDIPVDLHGYLRIEYDNIETIPELISQHNFTAFYNEDG